MNFAIIGATGNVGRKTIERTMDLVDFSTILYADDTLVFGTYTPHINAKLREIQK